MVLGLLLGGGVGRNLVVAGPRYVCLTKGGSLPVLAGNVASVKANANTVVEDVPEDELDGIVVERRRPNKELVRAHAQRPQVDTGAMTGPWKQ